LKKFGRLEKSSIFAARFAYIFGDFRKTSGGSKRSKRFFGIRKMNGKEVIKPGAV